MELRFSKTIKKTCPRCDAAENFCRDGIYFRKSDGHWIQRFRCVSCKKRFSASTSDPAYRQNKRKVNMRLLQLLASNVSLRRSARLLGVARKTIERKLVFLGKMCKEQNQLFYQSLANIEKFQFDDLQTIEHSKCKPLSVTLAVEAENRKILGFEVTQMPATGHLSKIAFRKYGKREDERQAGIQKLLEQVQKLTVANVSIASDEHPYYAPIVRRLFPHARYEQSKGVRGSLSGQGELKKIQKDPLFSINHTFAMLRANINRLIRKTWCTTKRRERLVDHLNIYVFYHNTMLTEKTA